MRTGTIRKLITTEKSLFRDHLRQLDAAGRRDRLMGGVADEFLVRYATGEGDRSFFAYAILRLDLQRFGAATGGPKAEAQLDLTNPNLDFVSLATSMVAFMRSGSFGERQ